MVKNTDVIKELLKPVEGDEANLTFWERYASLYPLAMSKNDGAFDEVCRRIKSYIEPGARVLEVACGTGQVTSRLAELAGTWVATDFSANMVEEAKASEEWPSNVEFEVADACSLPYAEGSFDAVVVANALHVMPHPEAALAEARRVLVPQGMLLAPTFVYESRSPHPSLAIMGIAGLKTFHKWRSHELAAVVEGCGFEVLASDVVPGKPLDECALIAKRA